MLCQNFIFQPKGVFPTFPKKRGGVLKILREPGNFPWLGNFFKGKGVKVKGPKKKPREPGAKGF